MEREEPENDAADETVRAQRSRQALTAFVCAHNSLLSYFILIAANGTRTHAHTDIYIHNSMQKLLTQHSSSRLPRTARRKTESVSPPISRWQLAAEHAAPIRHALRTLGARDTSEHNDRERPAIIQ